MIPRKKSQQKGSMYFDKLIQQFGDINRVPAKVLKSKIPLLIKDFAHGNLRLEKHGKYFTAELYYLMDEYMKDLVIEQSKLAFALSYTAQAFVQDTGLRNSSGDANWRLAGYYEMYNHIHSLYLTGDLKMAMTIIPQAMLNNYKYLF